MSEPFAGSVEIITHNGESRGVPGVRWTVDVVPEVVRAVAGITQLHAVTPEEQPSGRMPEAQWEGEHPDEFPVTVFLWRARPEDINGPDFPTPESA